MKLTILSLAILSVVGTSFAIPPRNYKAKKTSGVVKSGRKVYGPQQGGTKKKTNGVEKRAWNEGYVPAVHVDPPTPTP